MFMEAVKGIHQSRTIFLLLKKILFKMSGEHVGICVILLVELLSLSKYLIMARFRVFCSSRNSLKSHAKANLGFVGL